MITKTQAQASARAAGIWGARRSWAEGPSRDKLKAIAREALCKWLDGLTLVVRCPDVVLRYPEFDRCAQRLLHPWELVTGPFRVGSFYRLPGLGVGRTVEGSGWSWDEAFEKAEERMNKNKEASS